MFVYYNKFYYLHFGPESSVENEKRISIPLKNIDKTYIRCNDKMEFIFNIKLDSKNKNCPQCTFNNNDNINCAICGFNLETYFNYISNIDGDTTYIGDTSFKCLNNLITTITLCIDDTVLNNNLSNFLLIRPPGHHSYDICESVHNNNPNGFCLFNNIFYGAKYLLNKYKIDNIAIIDWDAHRANGTQNLVKDNKFIQLYDMYQSDIFPYDEKIISENIHNYELTSNDTNDDFKKYFNDIITKIKLQKPQFILISCGFDGYKDDTMSGLKYELATYQYFANELKMLGIPHIYFLEGGYIPEFISTAIKSILHIYNI